MSKTRRRIRRKRARPQPVRRSAAAIAARGAARERTASGSELMIGGARDPAEARPDARLQDIYGVHGKGYATKRKDSGDLEGRRRTSGGHLSCEAA